MSNNSGRDLTHNLILPTLLFAVLGGMTWAVRGCSGFGASAGCIFAGVTWGTAWWFIARDPCGKQSRRYASGWIILALTVGFGIAGDRGWMQWPHFFNNRLYTDFSEGEFVPISRAYGFLWLFLAGVPWAGIGACMLAWCGSGRRTSPWQWLLRVACGFGMAYFLGVFLYNRLPEVFLPLYSTIKERCHDLQANPNLRKLVRDNGEGMWQMGLYLGFLVFEIARRDWKNVKLILTVGVVNGLGWALCQNWMWAARLWPTANFNFWRSWETSGGISIGIAYGIAYYLVNRRLSDKEVAAQESRMANEPSAEVRRGSLAPAGLRALLPSLYWLGAYLVLVVLSGWLATEIMTAWYACCFALVGAAFGISYYVTIRRTSQEERAHLETGWPAGNPNLERWGAYTGLVLGLGLSVKNGLKGWANIYLGNEAYWERIFWNVIGPLMLVCLVALVARLLFRPAPRGFQGDVFPHAYRLIWLVLITQNLIAQLITGPHTSWSEVAFSIYYVLLFFVSAVIIYHYQFVKVHCSPQESV
jgi:hypothetical protein